jgi:hypothetical protein
MIEYSIFCNMIYVNMIINYQRIPLISAASSLFHPDNNRDPGVSLIALWLLKISGL